MKPKAEYISYEHRVGGIMVSFLINDDYYQYYFMSGYDSVKEAIASAKVRAKELAKKEAQFYCQTA